jgi:hypothetical protein
MFLQMDDQMSVAMKVCTHRDRTSFLSENLVYGQRLQARVFTANPFDKIRRNRLFVLLVMVLPCMLAPPPPRDEMTKPQVKAGEIELTGVSQKSISLRKCP